METKPQDVIAIIKLYELRRDPLMREARKWYTTDFNPTSAQDIARLMLSGGDECAFYRMVTSYWDMAGSFVLNGGIDEQLFLGANTEHVVIYAKIQPFLAEVREIFGEPDYLRNFEQIVLKVPDVEAKLERRRRLLANWANAKAQATA